MDAHQKIKTLEAQRDKLLEKKKVINQIVEAKKEISELKKGVRSLKFYSVRSVYAFVISSIEEILQFTTRRYDNKMDAQTLIDSDNNFVEIKAKKQQPQQNELKFNSGFPDTPMPQLGLGLNF